MARLDLVGLFTTPVRVLGPEGRRGAPRYEQGLDSGEPFQSPISQVAVDSSSYQNAAENLYAPHYMAYACVSAYADALASLPLKVYEKTAENERQAVPEGDLVELLEQPNPEQDGYEFIHWGVTSFLIGGENAIEKVRNFSGNRVVQLRHMRPDRFGPIVNEREGLIGYQFMIGTQATGYEVDEVIFFKLSNPTNEWRGLSPLTAARLAIETDLFAGRYNRNFLQNGSVPGGVLETEQDLLRRERNEIRAEWEAVHRNVNKAGRVAVLDKGFKYNGTALSQKDAQWLEGRQHDQEGVCVVYRMSPSILGIERSTNRSTAAEMLQSWYKGPVRALARRYERKLTLQLARTFNKNYFVEFLMDDVLRPDFPLRAEAGSKAWWITPNEKRRWENLPPMEGGDDLWIPVNMAAGGDPVNEVVPQPAALRAAQGNGNGAPTDPEEAVLTIPAGKSGVVRPFGR